MIIIKENRHVKKGLGLGFVYDPDFCRFGPVAASALLDSNRRERIKFTHYCFD
jgi:hypothetical protein